MLTTLTVASGMTAPVVSGTVPLMSPAFVACPKAAAKDPARRTPTSRLDRLIFIPNLPKFVPLCTVLIPICRLSHSNSLRQTVVFVHLAAREQYNRKRPKVVKGYLGTR